MGLRPARIPHCEHWSCPDAETYITGIDYYRHPRQCRLRLKELYPMLDLPVPETDDPREPPATEEDRREPRRVRWGDGTTMEWDWGSRFTTANEVFGFSPLAHPDFSGLPVVEARDYTDEERLYRCFRTRFPDTAGDRAPEGSDAAIGFYNTLFMWPLLTFGWERFMETCLDERFTRIMDEFAEISRRVFRAFSRLPVNFVICHDDIVTTRGPVCPPAWMRRHVFPRYEEYWSMLRAAGKQVIFMVDGCIDTFADDIFACGARGIMSEPYTDYRAIARRHPDCFLAGEGDNRVLDRDDPREIEAMVRNMLATADLTGGYMMCIGNHIPWNVNPRGVKRYLDLCSELARR